MNELVLLFTLAIVIFAAQANISIWSPRAVWVKTLSVVLVALFIPVAYMALSELMSRPKPTSIEWAMRHVPKATVLGEQIVEGEAVYLWLVIDGVDQPRSYSLPWNDNLAKQLHSARKQAEAQGTEVTMQKPFDGSILDTEELVFHPNPQAATLSKLADPGSGPMVFRGRNDNTARSN